MSLSVFRYFQSREDSDEDTSVNLVLGLGVELSRIDAYRIDFMILFCTKKTS